MRPVIWEKSFLKMIDQRRLPNEEIWLSYEDATQVAEGIKTMVVRGAPAIGVAAAYGLALESLKFEGTCLELLSRLNQSAQLLESTRPTAINLRWACQRMMAKAQAHSQLDLVGLQDVLVNEAVAIHEEDIRLCQAIGDHGAELVPSGAKVLTHCNAGALATGDYGTALGVIRSARHKISQVWVDETRPFLQGARLTAWELSQEKIPYKLICDNMAGHFMQRRLVDLVVVGADRITSSGAVANKIGTYSLAVLCRYHQIPFYVAAPYSTLDLELRDGMDIPIEEREAVEITHMGDRALAPSGAQVANPAFDVTPPELITAIITEKGIFRAPFEQGLRQTFHSAGALA